MKILVACEYSGIVSGAFRARGHDVTSCDLLPSEGHGQHHQGLVENLLHKAWDMIIAHPPCTYLCNAQLFKCTPGTERYQQQLKAIEFVKTIWNSPAPLIAIENPKGILSTIWQKPTQIIYPWHFGNPHRKDICLWLKGLPPLISTCYSTKRIPMQNHVNSRMTKEQRNKIKSRFFPEIAEAMANQWS